MAGFALLAFRLVDGLDENRADAQARAFAKTVRQRYEAARLAAWAAARRAVRAPAPPAARAGGGAGGREAAPRRGCVAAAGLGAPALLGREPLQRLTVVRRGRVL